MKVKYERQTPILTVTIFGHRFFSPPSRTWFSADRNAVGIACYSTGNYGLQRWTAEKIKVFFSYSRHDRSRLALCSWRITRRPTLSKFRSAVSNDIKFTDLRILRFLVLWNGRSGTCRQCFDDYVHIYATNVELGVCLRMWIFPNT